MEKIYDAASALKGIARKTDLIFAPKLCEGVKLFDIFRGEKIGEGKKSVAFRVILRAPDRTLTVEEADKVSGKILKDLSYKLGLNIRG